MTKPRRSTAPNTFDNSEHLTDPKLAQATRQAIMALMKQFPALQAVNIQLLYRDNTNTLRFHAEVGAEPQWTDSPDTLARVLMEGVTVQRLAWLHHLGVFEIDNSVARLRGRFYN